MENFYFQNRLKLRTVPYWYSVSSILCCSANSLSSWVSLRMVFSFLSLPDWKAFHFPSWVSRSLSPASHSGSCTRSWSWSALGGWRPGAWISAPAVQISSSRSPAPAAHWLSGSPALCWSSPEPDSAEASRLLSVSGCRWVSTAHRFLIAARLPLSFLPGRDFWAFPGLGAHRPYPYRKD